MKDWKCLHIIWSRKDCTLFIKRAVKKKFTLEQLNLLQKVYSVCNFNKMYRNVVVSDAAD